MNNFYYRVNFEITKKNSDIILEIFFFLISLFLFSSAPPRTRRPGAPLQSPSPTPQPPAAARPRAPASTCGDCPSWPRGPPGSCRILRMHGNIKRWSIYLICNADFSPSMERLVSSSRNFELKISTSFVARATHSLFTILFTRRCDKPRLSLSLSRGIDYFSTACRLCKKMIVKNIYSWTE